MFVNKPRETDPAAPVAAMARDLHYRQLALQLPERNRSAIAHCGGSDSPLLRLLAIFRSMPLPEFEPEEYAEIVRLVRSAIDGDRYPFSLRVRRLKSILAKIDPASVERVVAPYPAPRPSAEPSHVYAKLRGTRRR